MYFSALTKLVVHNEDLQILRTNICILLVERFASTKQDVYKGRSARKRLLNVFESKHFILAAVLDPHIKFLPFESKNVSCIKLA